MTDPTYEELMSEATPDPVIPFGKHYGSYASQIDVAYLTWLVGRAWVKEPLKGEIRDHLKTRVDAPEATPEDANDGA